MPSFSAKFKHALQQVYLHTRSSSNISDLALEMVSHKTQTQLQCALVCGSSSAGRGERSGCLGNHGSLPQQTWPGGVSILELHVAGTHVYRCCRRTSKPVACCMHGFLNGSICQLFHLYSSAIPGAESACWLRKVLAGIQEGELTLGPQFCNTLRSKATFPALG